MELTILKHYSKDDIDFIGDYWKVEVFDETGKCIYVKGDHYHDKGTEKVEGFIDGYQLASKIIVKIINQKIADGDY